MEKLHSTEQREDAPHSKEIPQEKDISSIVTKHFNTNPISIERFSTGLANYVYDVHTEDDRNVVVRVTAPENKEGVEATLYWSKLLTSKEIPLPQIYIAETDPTDGNFPFIIMERLPGTDLGNIYKSLDSVQKKSIAEQIAKIQQQVSELPLGNGFGYAKNYQDSLKSSWSEVVKCSLDRSRARIKDAKIIDPAIVDQVEALTPKYQSYFDLIEPVCFLDDITTKNVLVNEGKLSGIVDIEGVCFGDNLYTVALTQMSLLSTDDNLDYIHYWCDAIRATGEQKAILNFYTALFCVDFMGVIGQLFNKEKVESPNYQKIEKLNSILTKLLH